MESLLSKEELKTQFGIADFVLKTQQQIAKDFASSGFEFSPAFSESELNYIEIVDLISFQLEDILKLGEAKLLQLLYQIDVPQTTFLELIKEDDFVIKLSEIIIQREAYKVYLRSQF
jgi:hypothetical protein